MADQTSKGIPVPSQSPSRFFFPTPIPARTKSTKYGEGEGYKSPSLLVLRAQTFGEQPPLSLPVLNKPPILQSLRVLLGSSTRMQSGFCNMTIHLCCLELLNTFTDFLVNTSIPFLCSSAVKGQICDLSPTKHKDDLQTSSGHCKTPATPGRWNSQHK